MLTHQFSYLPRCFLMAGPGRPKRSVKYGGHITAAEDRIADALPRLIGKAFELSEGVLMKDVLKDGTVEYYKTPPNFKAIAYLVDRIMGKPPLSIEVVEADSEPFGGDMKATLAVILNRSPRSRCPLRGWRRPLRDGAFRPSSRQSRAGHFKSVVPMALVIRNGRPRLQRSVRRDGRVTTEYVGSGEFASALGQLEAMDREERRRQLANEREERDRLDADDRPVAELFRLVEIIAGATLKAAGYHRHHRGEWRRRRTMRETPNADPSNDLPVEMLNRAKEGDKTVLPLLREWIGESDGILSRVMDVATHVEEILVESTCGKNLLYREVMVRDIHALADKLAGPGSSPVENLLARRASLCWYTVHIYEKKYARSKSVTLALGNYLEDRIDRAHRRLLTSLKTLATVHRLMRGAPLVTVNVGQSVTVETPTKGGPSGSIAAMPDSAALATY